MDENEKILEEAGFDWETFMTLFHEALDSDKSKRRLDEYHQGSLIYEISCKVLHMETVPTSFARKIYKEVRNCKKEKREATGKASRNVLKVKAEKEVPNEEGSDGSSEFEEDSFTPPLEPTGIAELRQLVEKNRRTIAKANKKFLKYEAKRRDTKVRMDHEDKVLESQRKINVALHANRVQLVETVNQNNRGYEEVNKQLEVFQKEEDRLRSMLLSKHSEAELEQLIKKQETATQK